MACSLSFLSNQLPPINTQHVLCCCAIAIVRSADTISEVCSRRVPAAGWVNTSRGSQPGINPYKHFRRCAYEGEMCTCPRGNVTIGKRYLHGTGGAEAGVLEMMLIEGEHLTKSLLFTNQTSVKCTPSAFEEPDPVPGRAKQCFCNKGGVYSSSTTACAPIVANRGVRPNGPPQSPLFWVWCNPGFWLCCAPHGRRRPRALRFRKNWLLFFGLFFALP